MMRNSLSSHIHNNCLYPDVEKTKKRTFFVPSPTRVSVHVGLNFPIPQQRILWSLPLLKVNQNYALIVSSSISALAYLFKEDEERLEQD